MAITHFRSGNRLAPWWTLDPIAWPFGRLLGECGAFGSATSWIPPVNVEETTDELILTANLPGLSEEAIQIGLENGVLTIRGEISERTEGESRRYHLHERPFGRFQRSFTLPRTVSGDAIAATFDSGVLHVHMPKAPESKGRTIQIWKSS